jgi:antitoxin ParD1/3/4
MIFLGTENMPSSYTLGKYFEDFVQAQLASGRYNNASEVLRDALRLMEARERLADIKAGRVHDAEEVFDELEARFTKMADEQERP